MNVVKADNYQISFQSLFLNYDKWLHIVLVPILWPSRTSKITPKGEVYGQNRSVMRYHCESFPTKTGIVEWHHWRHCRRTDLNVHWSFNLKPLDIFNRSQHSLKETNYCIFISDLQSCNTTVRGEDSVNQYGPALYHTQRKGRSVTFSLGLHRPRLDVSPPPCPPQ